MRVLIVATEKANGIARVRDALASRGARVHHFQGERFPRWTRASIRLDGRTVERIDGLDVTSFDAVWLRKVGFGRALPRTMDPAFWQKGCESATVVASALLRHAPGFHLDPWWCMQRADEKPLQLRLAREVSLDVPPTLLTNDPDEVRAFAREYGTLVTKLPTWSGYIVPVGAEDEEGSRAYTGELGPSDLENLEGLCLCPMIFQPKIQKAFELRITIIGSKLFAAAVDSQSVADAQIDYRRGGALVWRRYEVPPSVADRLLALMDRLELNFGAVDMIVTPGGRHVFLEVNASGEYDFFEDELGFPLAGQIADLLVGRTPPRVAARAPS